MKEIYNYIIHYNFHEELWWGIPRDSYLDYWNGKKDNCLFATNINDLINLIKDVDRYNGTNQLLNGEPILK